MKKTKLFVVVTVLVLAVAMMFVACAPQPAPVDEPTKSADDTKTETPAPPTDEKITIGISTDAGFAARAWEVAGLYEKAEASGGKVEIIEQNADNDSTKQIQQIKAMVDQGVKAIVVCATDMNAILTAFDYAQEKGVIVTLYDRWVDHPAVQFCGGYDSFSDGKVCGEALKVLDTDGKDKVVFELVGNRADTNAIDRMNGFHEIADTMKNWKIVQIDTDWDVEKALSGMQNQLGKYPDVWGIYCASGHMDGSIETALKEVGKWKKVGEDGHVKLVSLGGEPPAPQICVDGYEDVLCVIMFDAMGGAIYDAIMTILDGGEIPADQIKFGVPTVPYTAEKLIAEKDTLYCMPDVKIPA